MNILELKNISKIYKTKKTETQALKEINLKIEKGKMIAIVGTSGSGKTTLLNIIGLLDDIDHGKYLLKGKDISKLEEKDLSILRNEMFGFVVQNFALISDYSVKDNILIPLIYSNKKIDKKNQNKRVLKLIRELGIKEKYREKSRNLSGGQKQRVAIARALINEPEIILADEPTGALDKKTSEDILNLLIKLKDIDKTIVIVTHDMEIAKKCDEIINIEDGRITNE